MSGERIRGRLCEVQVNGKEKGGKEQGRKEKEDYEQEKEWKEGKG